MVDFIPNLIYFDQYDDDAVPRGLSIKDRLAMILQSLSVANIRYHRDLQFCPTPLEHYKSPAPVSGNELYCATALACKRKLGELRKICKRAGGLSFMS